MAWVGYVLGLCIDQARFMAGLHGKLRFGVPQHALRFYFPRLWPEAEASSAS